MFKVMFRMKQPQRVVHYKTMRKQLCPSNKCLKLNVCFKMDRRFKQKRTYLKSEV